MNIILTKSRDTIMLSRHLSQLDSIHNRADQSKPDSQSDRLLKYINECAIVLNPDGIILNFNEQSKCQFHPESGTAISKHLKSEHMAWLKACMLGEEQRVEDLQFFTGWNVMDCKGECIPVSGEDAFILILKDSGRIPEELIYANVFKKAIHGLLIVKEDGVIVRSNLFADKLLDLKKDEEVNFFQQMDQFETKENLPGFAQQLAPHNESSMLSQIVTIGERSYEFTKVNHVTDGYHLIVIRDISHVIEYMDRADQQDTLKVVGQLAAGIAHEIRNPMTSLKGFVQLLEADLRDSQKMYFEVIHSELNRLEKTMTEFLMLAKPKNSLLQKINMTKVLEETVHIMQPQALLHGIELCFTASDHENWTFGDANRLKQVFINLIKNAIEATTGRGRIEISIHQKTKELIASVRDNGCGIPKEKLDKLNEPFYTTKENGTGLGLPVSMKIIEEHRGSVEVITRENEGTQFNISLPLIS
ncbi:ATP-binding protein [Jeotgalibacillus haloalkalitolerans]|uniref:histidine kinase n=1 Tax=Jeotgalibacillus haloalkalitolerans TaxID=3104292 RepID=A0ABU5KP51_9BACL|nr:ATP-binding protein [Jeotgalibacillus sp. HH7-29]MDZ5712945.1 ATP-binding protein [Jeotgalibacillus sp. HH7-29]